MPVKLKTTIFVTGYEIKGKRDVCMSGTVAHDVSKIKFSVMELSMKCFANCL